MHLAVEGGLDLVNLAVKEALQVFIRVDGGHFRFKVACALPAQTAPQRRAITGVYTTLIL